jgi:hypothetical protein
MSPMRKEPVGKSKTFGLHNLYFVSKGVGNVRILDSDD